MRAKHLTLLVAIFAIITMMFVSCNSEVAENSAISEPGKELVYASFVDKGAKELSFSYDVPAYNTLYWRYSAVKKDSYGTVGQTWDGEDEENEAFAPIPTDATTPTQGLDGKVGPFSQGTWKFKLQAFRSCTLDNNTLVFSDQVFEGTAENVVLNKNQTNYIAVTVTPAADTGKIKISDAYYEWASVATAGSADVKLVVTLVGRPDGSNSTDPVTYTYNEVLTETSENKYNFVGVDGYIAIPGSQEVVTTDIPAGVYTATFKIVENTETPTIDEFVLQTFSLKVYGGLETIISGNLTEGLSYENYFSVPEQEIAFTTSNSAGAASFVVDKTPSTATGESIKTTVVFPDNSLSTNTQHTLSVDVTTIETAETQFVIVTEPEQNPEVAVAAIGLELTKTTVTTDESGEVTDTTTSRVSEFTDYVTITTFIQDGLTGKITVVYNDPNAGTETAKTQPIAKEGATAETEGKSVATMYATDAEMGDKLGYSAESGKLRFKTDHFSDFYVKTDGLYVKNLTTGKYYPTLQTAVDAALEGQTLQLIQSISGISSVVVDSTKDITIDLNDKTITTGLKSEGRHYYAFDNYGSLTIKDSGTSGAIYARGAFENYGGNLTIESGYFYAVTDSADGGAVIWNENADQIDGYYVNTSDYNSYIAAHPEMISEIETDIAELDIIIEEFSDEYTYRSAGIGWKSSNNEWLIIFNKYSNDVSSIGNVTINGGSFIVEKVGSTSDSSGVACIINNGGNVEINAGSFISPNKRAYSVISNRGSMVINNATVEGAHGGIALDGGELILNSDISSTSTDYYGIWVTNNNEDVRIVVNGGSYSGKIGLNASVDDGNQDAADVEIIVNDGTFTGSVQSIKNNTKQTSHVWDMKLYGGYYSSDPAAYAAPGYTSEQISSNTWTIRPVTPSEAVAMIDRAETDLYYMSLQDAIDAAETGDIVVLLQDITVTSGIEITKGITLDGGNHTITANNHSQTMTFGGKIYDYDDACYNNIANSTGLQGVIIVYSNIQSELIDCMNVTVKNLSIDATDIIALTFIQYVNGTVSDVSITDYTKRGISAGNATKNSVKVRIEDCDVNEHGQSDPSAPWNAVAVAAMCGAEVEIDGGEYNGYRGLYIYSSGGSITVYESDQKTTRVSGSDVCLMHDGSGSWSNPTVFKIYGGSFDNGIYLQSGDVSKVSVSIEGGNFTSFSGKGWATSFGKFIKGGTFDTDPTAFVNTESYTVSGPVDGIYTVTAK